jgi:hypothetical protein
MLSAHDSVILQLFSYNCCLICIELACAKLKYFIREREFLGDVTMNKL